MSETKQFVDVLLPLAAPGLYTYSVPQEWKETDLIGKRVVVQFGIGKRLYTGIVVKYIDQKKDFELRDILDVVDEQKVVYEKELEFWDWMSEYYMCHPGEVMNTAVPGIMNLSSESRFSLNPDSDVSMSDLTNHEKKLVNFFNGNNEIDLKQSADVTGLKNPMKVLKNLMDNEVLVMREELKGRYKRKKLPWIGLSEIILNEADFDEVVLSLNRAPKQLQLLMKMVELTNWDGEEGGDLLIRKSELMNDDEFSESALKSLLVKNYLRSELREESRVDLSFSEPDELKELNDFQQVGLDEIISKHREKDVVLLHGVTSSGKTEIYAHLIHEQVKKGKQVLYLLPEISLTNQLINRLKKYFGNSIATYHSRISQNERAEVWHRVAKNNKDDIRIVLGARSSLFLPFEDLGLIIIDEEHDRSFKQQDPAPRYSARDSAIVLAKNHGAKVLLGSATPSLESIENAGIGKYGYVELKKRFGGFALPEMLAIDLNEERRKRKMKASFSSVLYNEINDTLNLGEQVILFQNRRGYAPFVLCNHCAHTPQCRNCDVSLTLHKKRNILICHYCGYYENMKVKCPKCEEGNLTEIGTGTERIEEELAELFPTARLARLDLDSTRKKFAFQKLLDDFETGNIDILIGTQMVTKGLDFENVGLVGIINADNMLRFPDFRSFERTFQMLTQVAGRAGRKNKQGRVIIQTYDPFHPVIQFVLSNNYKEFVKSEIRERKMFHYPPYFRVIEVRLKHRDRDQLYQAAKIFGKDLKKLFGDQLLGPEFPYIERIRNLYSMELVLKISKNTSVSNVKKKLSSAIADFTSKDNFKSIKVQVDVDPY